MSIHDIQNRIDRPKTSLVLWYGTAMSSYNRVQYRSEDRPVLLEYRLCFESRLSAEYRLYLLALLEPAVATNRHSSVVI